MRPEKEVAGHKAIPVCAGSLQARPVTASPRNAIGLSEFQR